MRQRHHNPQAALVLIQEPCEQQIVLEQTSTSPPTQTTALRGIALVHDGGRRLNQRHQTARLTIRSLILPMARVGLSPLGHTSTQFMMVWQRNKR